MLCCLTQTRCKLVSYHQTKVDIFSDAYSHGNANYSKRLSKSHADVAKAIYVNKYLTAEDHIASVRYG